MYPCSLNDLILLSLICMRVSTRDRVAPFAFESKLFQSVILLTQDPQNMTYSLRVDKRDLLLEGCAYVCMSVLEMLAA